MAHYSEPRCTVCGNLFPKEILVSKAVTFKRYGTKGSVLKSRTIAHICPEDLEKDKDWKIPANVAPGSKSPGLERVRAAQSGKK